MPQKIPMTLLPNTQFTLDLEGRAILFHKKYNTRQRVRKITNTLETDTGYWTLDLYENGELLLANIPLMLGTGLIGHYRLGLGELFMVNLQNNGVDADNNTLGIDVILTVYSQEDIAEFITSANETNNQTTIVQTVNSFPHTKGDT